MELIILFGKIGGNYPEVYDRLHDRALIEDCLRMFLTDNSFSTLKRAVESGSLDDVKESAHSLCDVARLLALPELYYRASSMETAANSLDCRKDDLIKSMSGIAELYEVIYNSIEKYCQQTDN